MGKPGFGIFQAARRKSSGNDIENIDTTVPYAHNTSPATDSSTFRVLNRSDIERAKQDRQEQVLKQAQQKSKFGRFSGFGASGNKGRTQSMEDDSPSSSKRDSKSSSGTQSFTSRPYQPGHYGGSSSTLPSSAESDPNDNMFSYLPPRPPAAQHSSSPSNLSTAAMTKQLPPAPNPSSRFTTPYDDPSTPSYGNGRSRAMTTSSYASTAIAPKLDADLDFGKSGLDDLFSGLERKPSPDFTNETQGRSLLAGRRTLPTEPIKIDRHLEVEPPPRSWDSRGSNEHLIASPTEDNSPPPPVPPHKYSKYAPVASHSPGLNGSRGFEDEDAKLVRKSVPSRKSMRDNSPEHNPTYTSSSSTNSLQTPLSSRSTSNNTTPKAVLRAPLSPTSDDDDNMFAPSVAKRAPARKPSAPMLKENIPPPSAPSEPARRVMTAAEFQAQKQARMAQPVEVSSDDEEDYEDEEEAIRKREEEQKAIRQKQQMSIAREHMRRSTTAPTDPNYPPNGPGPLSNGFPSETSLEADQWSDEDVPLGILAHHGFPNKNKAPTQPANAMPSYFRSSTPTVPDRPASTGAMGNPNAAGYRPPFARNLPDDPYASVVGGGLVRQPAREAMGFNRGAASVYNESAGGMGYEPQPQFTSLVDQIQMRDMAKQKYMGGASSKNKPQGGPFTGALSNQMNQMNQVNNPTRMPQMGMNGMGGMPGVPGMPGTNPMMMNMMGGSMPMMGMNQMQHPMYQQNELMMQQMYQQMLQMQAQQGMQMNGMYGQPQQQMDPHMSMAGQPNFGFQSPQMQNNNFLNVGNGIPTQRPMSIMSVGGQSNLQRPYSTPTPGMAPMGGFQNPMHLQAPPMNNGYTASIAPSERSNIGLSARYRPVVTGNGMDAQSTVSSMTLQASGGATDPKKVKGILKNKSPPPVREDDEDDWGNMAARKNKFAHGATRDDSNGLQELLRGVDRL